MTKSVVLNRGERNGQAKLTEAQVRDIRKRYVASRNSNQYTKNGNCGELAEEFGVNRRTIRRIADGEDWAWLHD